MSKNLLSILPVRFSVGSHGPFETGVIPIVTGWRMTITKGNDWPASNDVVDILIEQSSDGVNFTTEYGTRLTGGEWISRKGMVEISMDICANGNTNIVEGGYHVDIIAMRVTLKVFNACIFGMALFRL